MTESPQPRRKRHWIRNTFIGIAGVIVLIIVLSLTTHPSSPGSPTGQSGKAVGAASQSPAPAATTQPAPAPSPTVVPITRVRFVVTGNVPAGDFSEVDISYGSDSDSHDVTLPSLNGRVQYSVPFDGSAEFYNVDVTFDGPGQVSCKLVAVGPPPDVPLVVAHGSADGAGANSGGDCSAQAAPNNSTGESWETE